MMAHPSQHVPNFTKKTPQKTDLKPLSKDYPRKCVITGISLELEKDA